MKVSENRHGKNVRFGKKVSKICNSFKDILNITRYTTIYAIHSNLQLVQYPLQYPSKSPLQSLPKSLLQSPPKSPLQSPSKSPLQSLPKSLLQSPPKSPLQPFLQVIHVVISRICVVQVKKGQLNHGLSWAIGMTNQTHRYTDGTGSVAW